MGDPPPPPTLAVPTRSHPTTRHKPRLVYNFSCSILNKVVSQVAHKEAMHFGKCLYRVIECVLAATPKLGPTFLNKMDIVDAYMRIWVCLKDIPSVALLVPKSTPEEYQLFGFHISIPMGYELVSPVPARAGHRPSSRQSIHQ